MASRSSRLSPRRRPSSRACSTSRAATAATPPRRRSRRHPRCWARARRWRRPHTPAVCYNPPIAVRMRTRARSFSSRLSPLHGWLDGRRRAATRCNFFLRTKKVFFSKKIVQEQTAQETVAFFVVTSPPGTLMGGAVRHRASPNYTKAPPASSLGGGIARALGIERTRSIIAFAFDHVPKSAQSWGRSWGLGPPPSMCAHDYVLAFLVLAL